MKFKFIQILNLPNRDLDNDIEHLSCSIEHLHQEVHQTRPENHPSLSFLKKIKIYRPNAPKTQLNIITIIFLMC